MAHPPRRRRAALCASTALQAAALVALAAPARAQIRPTGGQVSAGQATIATGAATTTINQASQNAAINWQTYNVGRGQTVQYVQPNAASFTLNRVIAPQPSQIAGHIQANGRIAIVNQSGVVFLQGSTVDTAGLVVSASGITDADFMAGRLIFGAPARAGASVSNAGNITIRQAGLAALVAPQVRNSGTITAQLGRVILGGATTHTLDMYGDGLVALGVTGQVTQVQLGGHPVTALVTNTGTILAPGGTVVLTAQAADGVVTTAVSAGGVIAAPTAGGHAGRILVSGIGGDVEVDGAVSATGTQTSGTQGGQIEISGNHAVRLTAGASLDASGSAGGGTIAVGSSPARTATAARISRGARLRADATQRGNGGRITVHAGGPVEMHGTASAAGGPLGGDGGQLDFAGTTLLADGALSAAAPVGHAGRAAYAATGDLTVQQSCATGANCLTFANFTNLDSSAITDTDGSITFVAGTTPTLTSTQATGITLTTLFDAQHGAQTGNIVLQRGLELQAPDFTLQSAGSILIGGKLTTTGPGGEVTLSAAGTITEHLPGDKPTDAPGAISASTLAISNAGTVLLDSPNNTIAILAGAAPVAGSFTFTDGSSLAVTAPISATGSVAITVTGADPTGAGRFGLGHTLFIPADGGANNQIPVSLAGDGITLIAAGGISIGATANAGAGALSFDAQGGDVVATGALTATLLAAHATGSIDLTAATNSIASIGAGAGTVTGLVANTGSIVLQDAVSLAIDRALSAQTSTDIAVTTPSGAAPHTLDVAASITSQSITLATTGGLATTSPVLTLAGLLETGTATAGIYPGHVLLTATSGAIVESVGGAIHTGTLTATAPGNILLAQSGNQIAILAASDSLPGAISAGPSFSLLDGQNLTVSGLVSAATAITLDLNGAAPSTLTLHGTEVPAGTLALTAAGTIALIADSFAIAAPDSLSSAGSITAPGGLVALDVAHAGNFTVATGGTVDPLSLADISATTLALGSQNGVAPGNTTNLLIDTGSALGPTVLDLSTVASTLALFASGAITEEAPGTTAQGLSGIAVATLRGAAGQAISLDSASNAFGTVAGLTSANSAVTVIDARSLDVTGAISAAGTVALTVTPFPANFPNVSSLTIGADVTGSDVTLTSAPPSRPLFAAPGATIAIQSGATVTATGSAATPGTLTLTAGIGDISLAGTLAARTGTAATGAITLTASGGSLLELATGALAAGTLSAIAQTATLSGGGNPGDPRGGVTIGGVIDLASGTTAAGAAPINQIATLTLLSAAGDITLTDNAALTIAGPVTATSGNFALIVDTQAGSPANTLAVDATTISGRSVSLATAGAAATPPATAISLAAGSTISATGTPSPQHLIAGTLAIAASAGNIVLDGTLTGVEASGTPYFGDAALDATAGAITQGAAGAIRFSTFAAHASGNILLTATSGTLAGAATGNQIAETGTPVGGITGISTTGSLILVDGAAVTIDGPVSAGQLAQLLTPTVTLAATGSLAVATGGDILLAANQYTLDGHITAPDGLVALGLLTGGTLSIIAGAATEADQIGVADLAHITAATLALGSTDGVSANGNTGAASTWTASTAGSVALLQILAPLDSGAATLGLFSNGAILATGLNAITATSLYGAAATGITLDAASNQIGTLVPPPHATGVPPFGALFTNTGGIALTDDHTLFIEGSVSAQRSGVTITVTGLASAIAPDALHVDASLTGETVTLSTTGAAAAAGSSLPQIITIGAASQINATGTLTSSGTISIAAAQGDIDIAGNLIAIPGGLTELQARAGNIYETDAAFDAPSAATTPTGQLLTARLAAQAGPLDGTGLYSVKLDNPHNIIDDLVGFTTGAITASSATDTFSLAETLGLTVDAGILVQAGHVLSLTPQEFLDIEGTLQAGTLATSAPGTAAYAGTLILQTQLDITEGAAASLLAGTLTAASSNGGVLLDTTGATNIIATLAGLNTARTAYRLADSAQVAPGVYLPGQDVHVSGTVAANTGSLVLQIAHGNLDLDPGATLTAATAATLGADLGVLQNTGAITAATIAITAGAEFAQFQGAHITALGAPATAPSLAITAGGGFTNDITLSNGTTLTLFGIALGGTDVASSTSGHGPGSITLLSPLGDISQTAPTAATTLPPVATGTILADSLAFQAGTPNSPLTTATNAWLNSAGNSITILSGIAGLSSATGTILLTDTAPLTIAAGARVAATNAAGLPSALSLQTTASLTIDGTLQAGTLATTGPTTAAYTGALTLFAGQGDIAEGPAGQILASTLLAKAAAGNVTLADPANTVTTLLGTSSASGNFALADTAQASSAATLPGQDVFVTGPVLAGGSLTLSVTHGNLVLEPGAILTATDAATLSADLAVLQLGGTLTAGTAAITAGGAFVQLAGTAITAAGEPGQTGPVAPFITIVSQSGAASTIILPGGQTVSLSGITIGGQNTAGPPGGPGHITLISQAGDITQAAPGATSPATLQTGTLAFQAGSFEGASPTLFNVLLDGQNAFGTLSGLTLPGQSFLASSATGSITLVDNTGLAIAANTRVEAGNTANLLSALTIDDQGALSISGTLQAGVPRAATPAPSQAYTGALTLQDSGGSITEGPAGAVLAYTLNARAPNGSIALGAAGNTIAYLTGPNLAGLDFTLTDNAALPDGAYLPLQDVTILGAVTAEGGALTLDVTHGNLALAPGATLTAATAASLAADLGIIQNTGAITAGTVAINAGAEFAQFQGAAITATGITGGAAPLLAITAGGGYINDLILPSGATITLLGIALGGTDTATGAAPGSIRLLSPGGDISQTSPGSSPATNAPPAATGQLVADSLAFQAGNPGGATPTAPRDAWLNADTNAIGTLTGIATTLAGTLTQLSGASGQLYITDAANLTLAANTLLDAGNTTAPESATLFGLRSSITLAGTLASNSVDLGTLEGNITQTTGRIIAGTLTADATTIDYPNVFNITLNSASNSIGTLGGTSSATTLSSASGNFSLTDSTGLTVAANTTVQATILTLHTLAGDIAIAGTLENNAAHLESPGGFLINLRADQGNITETTAASRLITTELNVAAPAGSITLASAGNVVTSLIGSNTALGGFTLVDAAATLPGQNAFIDGSINAGAVTLAVTGGNLLLEPAATLTASSAVSLSADLGIVQYGGRVAGHAIALTAGAEIAQLAGASLIATPLFVEGHDLGASLTLQARGANALVLPDGHTITLAGIALGGLDSATGAGVSTISLTASNGDISQTAPTDATSTNPTTTPPAATGTLITDILRFQAGSVPAEPATGRGAGNANTWLNSAHNRIGQLGAGLVGAAREVDLKDTQDLTLDGATTLSAGGNLLLGLTGHTLTQLAGSRLTASGNVQIGATLLDQGAGAALTAGHNFALSGALAQSGAALTAGQSVTVGGSASQTQSTLAATAGSLTIGGALAQSGSHLSAGKDVLISGPATQSASTLAAQGGVTIAGALTQAAQSTLIASGAVTTAAAVTQSGASLLTAGQTVSITGTLAQTASTLAAGTGVSVGGNLVQNNSTLTAQSGNITLRGGLTQTNASLLAARAGAVSIAQSASQDDSAVLAATSVTIGGPLTQADHATLTATSGSVAITGAATQSASQLAAGAAITIGGALTQTAASLSAGQSVSVTGDVLQSGATLTALAGDVTLGGSLDQSAASLLSASGSVGVAQSVTQSASALSAGAGVAIGAALTQTGAQLTAGQSVTIAAAATQTASTLAATAGSLTIGGTLAQSGATLTAAQSVAITGSVTQSASTLAAGQSVTIGGNLDQSGATLTAGQSVAIGGSLTQTDSLLTAGSGSITIGGLLAQTGAALSAAQAITIGGDATQTDSMLTAAGLAVTGSLTQSASTLTTAADITLGGSLTQSAASTLATTASGALTVGGSLLQTDSLVSLSGALGVADALTQTDSTLQAGQNITLRGGGALTQSGRSTLASTGAIAATLAGGFSQSADSTFTAGGPIALDATTGDLAFEGLVQAGGTAPLATLIAAAGNITSNAGTLRTETLAAQASGNLTLAGPANAFATISPVTAGTTALAGLVAGGTLSVQDGANLTLQAATISGTSVRLTAPGHTLLEQGGTITATAGNLSILAGNLTQDAAGSIIAPAGTVQISAPGTLSFAGLLEAPRILLGETASGTGADTQLLQDAAAPAAIDFLSGSIVTDSAIPIVPGAQPDLPAPITGGADATLGLFATAAGFTQTGTTTLHTLSGEPRQTVQFRLTGPGGTIAFDPAFSATSGLFGPETQLLLDLRTTGLARGNIVVAGLNVFYGGAVANPLGRASLTGSVDMRDGTAAASTSFIHTQPGVNYQFNACPIQSLNCVLLSPFVVPLGSPVRDLEVSVGHRREDDDDLILPNVAEQDY